MEFKVINQEGQDVGSISLKEEVFGREYNEALVHQVVTAFLANARAGNRAQKTRAEVSKTTKKPWRQKGTGRARSGMASSPIWRGGGRAFANRPDENFTQKINRKMYRAALSSILSKLVCDSRLVVADTINVDTPKTKGFTSILSKMSLSNDTVLIVVNELTEDLFLASRNLHNVLVLESHQINPYSLLRCSKVVFEQKVVEELQEQWV